MTRTKKEFNEALKLHSEGKNSCEIFRQLSIPRGTIRDWISNRIDLNTPKTNKTKEEFLTTVAKIDAYIYLLGSYLGDGCITHPQSMRSPKIRIACDNKQPFIIETNINALNTVFEAQKVSIQQHGNGNCSYVGLYSTALYDLFPQAIKNSGPKNLRTIELEIWQQELLVSKEHLLLKGLFHSDGSFFKISQHGRHYFGYQFTNTSKDIIQLIENLLTKLSISFTKRERKPVEQSICEGKPFISSPCWDISIRKQDEVKKLYKLLGTKYNEIIEELL